MTPDVRFLYVTNSNPPSDITAYAIGSDGALGQIPGSPFAKGTLDGPGPQAAAMLPDQGPAARFSVNSTYVRDNRQAIGPTATHRRYGRPRRLGSGRTAGPPGRLSSR
jgi:hypothetical protein